MKYLLNGYCYYAALQATLLFLVNPKGMISRCVLFTVCFSPYTFHPSADNWVPSGFRIQGSICCKCKFEVRHSDGCKAWIRKRAPRPRTYFAASLHLTCSICIVYPRLKVIQVQKFTFPTRFYVSCNESCCQKLNQNKI